MVLRMHTVAKIAPAYLIAEAWTDFPAWSDRPFPGVEIKHADISMPS